MRLVIHWLLGAVALGLWGYVIYSIGWRNPFAERRIRQRIAKIGRSNG